ncbi:MAG: dihydroorotase [Candidatus Odinarchaeia archaeon]
MLHDLKIKNVKICRKDGIIKGNILISNGKIVKITKNNSQDKADVEIDGKNKLVLPGIIDMHVHLRDLNQKYKEDFYSGTCAAAAGGVTTVVDMPNNDPPTDSLASLKRKIKKAKASAIVNVGFYCAPPIVKEEISEILKAGAFGFKVYLNKHIGGIDPQREEELYSFLMDVKRANGLVLIHPEEPGIITLEKNKTNVEQFLAKHHPKFEKNAVKQCVKLAKKTGCRIHLCHVSCGDSIELIRGAKLDGALVTCEVTPHHLLLTEETLKSEGAIAKVAPPLRTLHDIQQLWRIGLEGGVADVLATDHAPHTLDEKNRGFSEAPCGFPGLETILPLMFTKVINGELSLSRFISLTSENPARILNLKNKGGIYAGLDADLVLVSTEEEYTINPEKFYSKSKLSPFKGWRVKAKPVLTLVKGIIIMDEGKITAPKGCAEIVFRES